MIWLYVYLAGLLVASCGAGFYWVAGPDKQDGSTASALFLGVLVWPVFFAIVIGAHLGERYKRALQRATSK